MSDNDTVTDCPHDAHLEKVILVIGNETVGQVCTDCWAGLPVWWGCPNCETVEDFRLSDRRPHPFLTKACKDHQVML